MVGYDLATPEAKIPQQYSLVPEDIIEALLNDVVLELMQKSGMLQMDGLTRFGVQGNIINETIQPWEIFRGERFMKKQIEMER